MENLFLGWVDKTNLVVKSFKRSTKNMYNKIKTYNVLDIRKYLMALKMKYKFKQKY